jgi:hypothetical protein
MINSSNLIVITTTLSNNTISEKRRNNIINNFSKYNISVVFNHGIMKDGIKKNEEIMFEILKNSMEFYKKTDFDYAILCDDDFFIIDHFLEELNKTVEILPENWRCLHLCPGYLWGRRFRNKDKISKLNPEYTMDSIDYHTSERFYLNCDSEIYFNKNFWLGGPISLLINKKNIDHYLTDFINTYNTYKCNNDVILTIMLKNNDFICREPMLGYEEEEGGSTYT